jgi:hypothetical protein
MRRVLPILAFFLFAGQTASAACNWSSKNITLHHFDSCKGFNWTHNFITIYVEENGTYTNTYGGKWSVNGVDINADQGVIGHEFTSNGLYRFCVKLTDKVNNCDTTICQDVYINCVKCPNWKQAIDTVIFGLCNACPSGPAYGMMKMKSGVYSYLWTVNDDTLSLKDSFSNFVPISMVNYYICIKIKDSASGCDTTICQGIYWILGVQERAIHRYDLKVFPNPASRELRFESENTGRTYVIYDYTGRKVYGGTTTQGLNTLDVKEFVPGVYVIKLQEISGEIQSVFFVNPD